MYTKRLRQVVLALSVAGAFGSCTADDPTLGIGVSGAVELGLRPALVPSPADATALPVQRIHAMVAVEGTNVSLADERFEVLPTDTTWTVQLTVPVIGRPLDVRVLLTLLNVAEDGTESIQFSGRSGRVTLGAGSRIEGLDLDIVRGPPANMTVTQVIIESSPDTLVEGTTAVLGARATAEPGSAPEIFWTSLDPDTVAIAGSTAQAVRPGSARVVASAGAFADTATIVVIPRRVLPGVVADWTLDEGSGQVAADALGTMGGQLGTTPEADAADPAWIVGRVGSALSFSGAQQVIVPDDPALEPTQLTIEAFVRGSPSGPFRYVVAKGGGPGISDAAAFALYTGGSDGLQFYTSLDGGSFSALTAAAAPAAVWDGNWHHVAGTYDGTQARLFLDGVEIGTPVTGPLGYATQQQDFTFGVVPGIGFTQYTGDLDEVRLWSRALTPAEIAVRAAR